VNEALCFVWFFVSACCLEINKNQFAFSFQNMEHQKERKKEKKRKTKKTII
jgi:hypothetical protein